MPYRSEVRGASSFGQVVASARATGRLVVQPRMGFADPAEMRQGLLRTKHAAATTVGTVTVDSYTRVGDDAAAAAALTAGQPLNGYPITAHHPDTNRAVLDGVRDPTFPVQVRHGASDPRPIIDSLMAAGLDATEGGPISYCLPYSRTPLLDSVRYWVEGCERLARLGESGTMPHLETFGGCMLGQLCPPGMLVAVSVLEAMFFAQHGIRCVSLSYAQQVNAVQDEEAVWALKLLADELLPGVNHHVVVYAYMGVYPRTRRGAMRLLARAAELAVCTGAARLIVKTAAEAARIPTVDENVEALELAAAAATYASPRRDGIRPQDTGVYAEARAIIEAVQELSPSLAGAIPQAFARGLLDIPYCLHPDNAGSVRSYLDQAGRIRWADTGGLPIPRTVAQPARLTAAGLAQAMSFVQRTFDEEEPDGADAYPG